MNAKQSIGRVDGENLIISQSWLNQLLGFVVFFALVAGTSYVTIVYPRFSVLPLEGFDFPFLMFLPLFELGRIAYRVCNERLVVTPKYMIHVTGRLWWRERSVRLEYSHIQEIEISESIFQRIIGVGDMVITPFGGHTNAAISIKGLWAPRAVKDLLLQMKTQVEQGGAVGALRRA